MRNIVFAAMIFLATTGLAQQTTKQMPSPAKPVSSVKSETLPRPMTEQLEKRVSELEKEIQDLKESHAWLQKYAIEQISRLQHPTASFDPSSPGPYQLIDGSIGPMLVSIGKVEQYLDGYSVQLEIGNITAASLNGFKVSAKWSRRYKKDDGNFLDWYKSLKTKDFGFTGTLASGVGTPFR